MDKEPTLHSPKSEFDRQKTKYFSTLALRVKEAMELHKQYGLLEKNADGKREWGNVSEHCLVEVARAQVLSRLLNFSKNTQNQLTLAAAVHDFYKKKQIERTPRGVSLTMKDYMESEEESAAELMNAGIPQEIIDYAGSVGSLPDNMEKMQTILSKGEDASEEEIALLVMHYIDDYTRESYWAQPAEINAEGKKINDLNRRLTTAFNNPKYKSIDEEGREYFDGKTSHEVQETVGESVEEFLAKKIEQTRGVTIDPKSLPTLIDEEVKKEIMDMEWKERLPQIGEECLRAAKLIHDSLGRAGIDLMEKNQFGETALRGDYDCEGAVIDVLRRMQVPVRIVSEEHGEVDITANPRFLAVLDGIDGSSQYKEGQGERRYGTMFALFDTVNPTYNDYIFDGIMEHSTGRLFSAVKNKGAFVSEGNGKKGIHTSKKTELDDTLVWEDRYFEINRKTFPPATKGLNTKEIKASCVAYADLANGEALLVLECTRKNNLELAIAFGLITEAGGEMVDLNGEPLNDKRYLEFGQGKEEYIPIITAGNKELKEKFLARLKESQRL